MDIRPFRGLRYAGVGDADVSACIAPPYDVLSREDLDALLARSEHNITAVDLPHFPPHDEGPAEAYAAAAGKLQEWIRSGVLVQENSPALYAYEQEFRRSGQTFVRRALLCGVRATELGQAVIPHEHTFPGPRADRMKLTEHTHVQLSPIFGFYDDPQQQVRNLLWSAATGAPVAHGQLREVSERMWAIRNPNLIAEVAAILRDVPVYIADGHHRYTTAMEYAKRLREAGKIDAEHEANFVLFALVARDDPGMLILPTHRIVHGLKPSFRVSELAGRVKGFTWKRFSVDDVDLQDTDRFLRRYGHGAMAFFDADPAEVWVGRLEDPAEMLRAAADQSPAWRALDVAVLHKLVIDEALSPWRTDKLFIEYTPEASAVLASCKSGRAQLGICLRGTPIESVQTIADQRGSMPHKSTYFYPKLATGMVLKPLW